jgi:hypothetical protein
MTRLQAVSIDFRSQIQPIFDDHCLDCHDTKARKGGVALDHFFASQQLTDNGEKILIPRDPSGSLLVRLISSNDPKHRMPPKGDPLTPAQIEWIRSWIAEGAAWPDDGWRPSLHWAYLPPKLSAVPSDVPGRIRNEIDAFIHSGLARRGVEPNADADPAVQLRRLSLDLRGLSPSVEEVDAFLNNPSDAAWEKAVDAFLASPAFGERWARQWLDAARYADSEGYQRDELRSMWPYRDWVIQALNADMPFDRFTIEQLAGDLLPNPTLRQRIATGFQRNTPLNLEAGTDPVEDHYKQVVDRVNVVGSVWLGTTLGCAQCHNHKYDPLSIGEYYGLFAYFNQTPYESRQGRGAGMVYLGPDLELPREEAERGRWEPLEKAAAATLSAVRDHMRATCESAQKDTVRFGKLSMDAQEALLLGEEKRELPDYQVLLKALFPRDPEAARLMREAELAKKRLAPFAAPRTRVMQELLEKRATHIARRGDFLSKGPEVQPGVPAVFGDLKPGGADRLALARWIVHPEHPLTARVTVNRIWAELFGRGIVSTLEEFGKQGDAPSHPELLDWLAVTFVRTDAWSLKALLKRMVLSSTYRRSSALRGDALERDVANVGLWRHPGHRLDAETIRDNALLAGGLLSPKAGGPPVYPPQPEGVWREAAGKGPTQYVVSEGEDRYRRGIYTVWKRNNHYPAFAAFDAPDRGACTLQRGRSNTPVQALVLLNDEAFVEAAHALGKRMETEFHGSPLERLVRGFRTVLSRHPTDAERTILERVYRGAEGTTPHPSKGFEDAATVILNLHETIHRG